MGYICYFKYILAKPMHSFCTFCSNANISMDVHYIKYSVDVGYDFDEILFAIRGRMSLKYRR